MLMFIMIIASCFRGVGRSVRAMEDAVTQRRDQLFVWAMGAALFAHVITFMSVSYFDQNIVNWYLLLAMIATATDQFVRAQPREHEQADLLESNSQVYGESRLAF